MKVVASQRLKSKVVLTSVLFLILFTLSLGMRYVTLNAVLDTLSETDDPVTVIIDAGHGGIDGGTSAKDGTVEKDINLQIAVKLRDILDSMGIKTVMTRTDDRSIHDTDKETIREQKVSDIKNRLKIIEDNPNSLFISIHQNFYTNSKYSGTQVFYSKNDPQSAVLAEAIRSSVVSDLQKENTREIKQSGKEIYLLYHSKAPSVMVECGFLSNEHETELLKNNEYQQKLAFLIALGIRDFINTKER